MKTTAMERLNNGVNARREELIGAAALAASKINQIGNVLTNAEVTELVWTLEEHVGNIIGHYYADEASLVGMTTWAGEILMAIRTAEDVLNAIAPDFLAKDGKGTKAYTSQFTDEDMAVLTGCRGLKLKAVVVKGEEVAKKILKALKEWDVVNAEKEEVFAFVLDMARMIRSCQEIEIDITKDKTLTRFMELVKMIAPGAYILTNKFKTRATRTNPGLVTNIRDLRSVRLDKDRAEINYNLSVGHLSYTVGTEEISPEVVDCSEVTCEGVVKTVDKAMVEGSIVDDASKFQEQLMDKSMPLFRNVVEMARMATTDYVITDVKEAIDNNTMEFALKDLAIEMAPMTKAIGDYDRILTFSNVGDKKGQQEYMSNVLRNTYRRLYSSHNSVYTAMTKEALAAKGTNFKEEFSRVVVASELCKYNVEKKEYEFELKHEIPVVKRYCRAEYLTLAVEEANSEFIVNNYKAYGVFEETEEGEVTIAGRTIVKDGEVVGRVITDKLAKKVDGRKFFLEKTEDGFNIVEKMSIQAMRTFPVMDDVLVTMDIVEFGEFTKERLSFTGKPATQELLDLREEYIQELRADLTSEDINIVFDYDKNAFVDVHEDGNIVMPLGKKSDCWRDMLQGLTTKVNLTPEDNKSFKAKAVKENKAYAIKEVFLTGNKVAVIVAAK